VELTGGFLFLLDCDVEVVEGLIEVVQLVVEEASKEEQTGLPLLFAAGLDGDVEEPQSQLNFVSLRWIVNELAVHAVGVAADDADGVQAEGVLVLREAQRGLSEVLTCHQVLFSVHLEDATAQPLVVDGRFVQGVRANLLRLPQVFEGILVLLDGHIAVSTVDVDVENEEVIHGTVELATGHHVPFVQSGLLVDSLLTLHELALSLSPGVLEEVRVGLVHGIAVEGLACQVAGFVGGLLLLLRLLLFLDFLLAVEQDLKQVCENLHSFLDLFLH